MTTLYLDCFSGISGDMVIGALIDAGADPEKMEKELAKLQMADEYRLTWKKIVKNGITSTKFDVLLKGMAVQGHSHDQEQIPDHVESLSQGQEDTHIHEHGPEHDHNHVHDHAHNHHHAHGHEHSHHGHAHRSYQEIVKQIESSELSAQVKDTSLRIFKRIGEAEARIHGIPLEQVHFHEVGAVDSIIDIVGTAILIHQLGISSIKSSPVPVGSGKIHIDHGIYPVPAPATVEMLKGVPIEQSDIKGELTTPTGAAIATTLAEEFCPIPSMKIQAIGYGAGTKTFESHPNVLRVMIGEKG